MIAQFLILAATLLAGAAYARCPSQEWSEYEGNCYLVAKASINHPQAQANCTAKGANLLSVHNEAENQFVKELLRKLMAQTGAGGSFHIGMMFSRSNPDATGPITSAVWMDGTPVDFGNPAEKGFQPGTGPWSDGKWHGGEAEPNGDGLNRHGPVELCVTVPQSQLVNGEWADSNCGSLAGMICKKPAPSASATV